MKTPETHSCERSKAEKWTLPSTDGVRKMALKTLKNPPNAANRRSRHVDPSLSLHNDGHVNNSKNCARTCGISAVIITVCTVKPVSVEQLDA